MILKTPYELSLKSIKHFEQGSEETFCYHADLFAGNKKIAHVSNSGHGGCDLLTAFDKEKVEEIEAYLKTVEYDCLGKTLFYSIETVCCELVVAFLHKKDLKRSLKKLCVIQGMEVTMWDFLAKNITDKTRAQLKEKVGADVIILNDLPFDEALAKYCQCMDEKANNSF